MLSPRRWAANSTFLPRSNLAPTEDFTDRVMAAVAAEPSPQPIAALGTAVRGGRLGAALAAIGDSWRVAFGSSRPAALRAQAFAMVLVVAVVGIGLWVRGRRGGGVAWSVDDSRALDRRADAEPVGYAERHAVAKPEPKRDAFAHPITHAVANRHGRTDGDRGAYRDARIDR